MTNPQRDPIREKRIHNEVVVDAYGPKEQARGWYYYLEDKIGFQAKCIVAKVVSPLLKGADGAAARMGLKRTHADLTNEKARD